MHPRRTRLRTERWVRCNSRRRGGCCALGGGPRTFDRCRCGEECQTSRSGSQRRACTSRRARRNQSTRSASSGPLEQRRRIVPDVLTDRGRGPPVDPADVADALRNGRRGPSRPACRDRHRWPTSPTPPRLAERDINVTSMKRLGAVTCGHGKTSRMAEAGRMFGPASGSPPTAPAIGSAWWSLVLMAWSSVRGSEPERVRPLPLVNGLRPARAVRAPLPVRRSGPSSSWCWRHSSPGVGGCATWPSRPRDVSSPGSSAWSWSGSSIMKGNDYPVASTKRRRSRSCASPSSSQ